MIKNTNAGAAMNYITGFIISLLLTLAAYFLVRHHIASGHLSPSDNVSMAILSVLATAQLAVQLVLFLHLGRESKPRWNSVVFLFALTVVVILVFGSLWIMNNLSYNGMTPRQTNNYIIKDEGIGH